MGKVRNLKYNSGVVESPKFNGNELTKWIHNGVVVWENGSIGGVDWDEDGRYLIISFLYSKTNSISKYIRIIYYTGGENRKEDTPKITVIVNASFATNGEEFFNNEYKQDYAFIHKWSNIFLRNMGHVVTQQNNQFKLNYAQSNILLNAYSTGLSSAITLASLGSGNLVGDGIINNDRFFYCVPSTSEYAGKPNYSSPWATYTNIETTIKAVTKLTFYYCGSNRSYKTFDFSAGGELSRTHYYCYDAHIPAHGNSVIGAMQGGTCDDNTQFLVYVTEVQLTDDDDCLDFVNYTAKYIWAGGVYSKYEGSEFKYLSFGTDNSNDARIQREPSNGIVSAMIYWIDAKGEVINKLPVPTFEWKYSSNDYSVTSYSEVSNAQIYHTSKHDLCYVKFADASGSLENCHWFCTNKNVFKVSSVFTDSSGTDVKLAVYNDTFYAFQKLGRGLAIYTSNDGAVWSCKYKSESKIMCPLYVEEEKSTHSEELKANFVYADKNIALYGYSNFDISTITSINKLPESPTVEFDFDKLFVGDEVFLYEKLNYLYPIANGRYAIFNVASTNLSQSSYRLIFFIDLEYGFEDNEKNFCIAIKPSKSGTSQETYNGSI